MNQLFKIFEKAAAHIAANLGPFGDLTLGFNGIGKWYEHNGHFKFPVDTKIDCKGPQYFGYGLNPQGWTVKEHTKNSFGGDAYVIETAEGERQTHFKWNIENQFKIADPNAKPFDPNRFTPAALKAK